MSETTCYQRNREVMLNRVKKYYQDNKKILKEKVRNKFRELSDEQKYKKRIWKK